MALFRRKRGSIGLDIGSGYLKAVEVDHSGARPEVVRLALLPLPTGALVEREVMDPGLITDTLRELLSTFDRPGKQIVSSIGGHDVIVKAVRMDRMTESDTRQVIRWEAEQHVPFAIDSVEVDFEILDPAGTGSEMEVLLVAAKRELVETRAALLSRAGAEPDVIDVEAFALHNALEVSHPVIRSGVRALVNIGHENTNLNLLDEGRPVMTRDLAFGTGTFADALRRERGMTVEESERTLRSDAFRTDFPGILAAGVEEVVLGIERAAAFLRPGSAGSGVGTVHLSGGGACIPGLADALGQRMGVETRVVNPFAEVRLRPGAEGALPIGSVAPIFLLAVGLALRVEGEAR